MPKPLHPAEIRFRVDPGDVPPEKAARQLHLTLEQFNELLPKLQARGFPRADPDTGMFDLDEIDRWRAKRHTSVESPAPPTAEPELDMGERFIIAMRRKARARRIRRKTKG